MWAVVPSLYVGQGKNDVCEWIQKRKVIPD